MSETGPDLLAVDDVIIAVEDSLGVQCRKIAAGVRFGKSLTPNLLAGEHGPQISLLLGFRAQRDNRRPHQSFADHAQALGRTRERQFFLKNRLLNWCGAPATILGWPGDASPATVK